MLTLSMFASRFAFRPECALHIGVERECILIADLDMEDIKRGKFDFDVVGHYARPVVFKLVVDETPKP